MNNSSCALFEHVCCYCTVNCVLSNARGKFLLRETIKADQSVLTELLRWVDILHFISVDVDHDDLSGAVRQTGVQTGHCDQNNNITTSIVCS